MSSAQWAGDIGNVLLMLTAALAGAIVLVYATTRWWETAAGRNVMAFMACVAAVTGLHVLRLWYVGGLVFLWLRVAVFALVPLVLAWRLWMLIRAQFLDTSWTDEKEDDDARPNT